MACAGPGHGPYFSETNTPMTKGSWSNVCPTLQKNNRFDALCWTEALRRTHPKSLLHFTKHIFRYQQFKTSKKGLALKEKLQVEIRHLLSGVSKPAFVLA